MKYLEEIRLDILRRRDLLSPFDYDEDAREATILNGLLESIDSLLREPAGDDLEKVISLWWDKHYAGVDKTYTFLKYYGHYISNGTLLELANHIAWWQKNRTINKACEFLKLNRENVETEDNGIAGWISDDFIENFRKYLEG